MYICNKLEMLTVLELRSRICIFITLLSILKVFGVFSYKIPNVKLEVWTDRFKVSIPDSPGVKYVVFNINRNKEFHSFEPGEFSSQIREPVDNSWIFESRTSLDIDDVLYIWTNVQHDKLMYRSTAQPIPVISVRNKTSNHSKKCEVSLTTVNGRISCKGQLIFEENFNTGIDMNKWKNEIRFSNDNGDAEFVLYENVTSARNGILTIEPKLWNEYFRGSNVTKESLNLWGRCTGNVAHECKRVTGGLVVLPPIVSGRINTKESFAFKYGRIEIRAKLPTGDWLVPLLLLEPLRNQYGLDPYVSGQIRIAFIRGNPFLFDSNGTPIDGRTLFGGAVLSPDSSLREKSMVKVSRREHFGNEFRTYSMEWNDKNIILKTEGEIYGKIDGDFSNRYATNIWNGKPMAPFDQEFFITLGLSVGGHGDFPDGSYTQTYYKPWNNTSPKALILFQQSIDNWKETWTNPKLQVDYVKVYAI